MNLLQKLFVPPSRLNIIYHLTPNWIADKATINPQNKNQLCFKWADSIAMFTVSKRDRGRITKEISKKSKTLNWDGIGLPTLIDDNSLACVGEYRTRPT